MGQDPKEIVLERAYQLGFECGRIYRGCSQCVVAAVQDTLGIRDDAVFKAATGLVGGIPREVPRDSGRDSSNDRLVPRKMRL